MLVGLAQDDPGARRLDALEQFVDRQVADGCLIPALVDAHVAGVVVDVALVARHLLSQFQQVFGSEQRVIGQRVIERERLAIELARELLALFEQSGGGTVIST